MSLLVVHLLDTSRATTYCGRYKAVMNGRTNEYKPPLRTLRADRVTNQTNMDMYIFDDERICKSCKKTSNYGMLLLQITELG